MIIKSNPMVSSSNPLGVYDYFATNDKNEDIELLKGNPQDVENCFADGQDFNRKNAMRHFQVSSRETLTDEQFRDAISRIQQEFDIPDEDIVLSAIHTYRGHSKTRDPRHGHFGIRLVNSETGQVRRFDNLYQRQEKIARMFEVDHGLQLVKGRHNVAVYENVPQEYKDAIKPLTEGPLPNSFVRDGAYQAMKRNGGKPFDIRAEAKEILSRCDGFQSFQSALQEKGWTIAQGEKKLILNDENGKFVGSLDRILGMKKDEFTQFIAGHEITKNEVARPTVGGTTTHNKTGEGLHPVEPAQVSKKPSESKEQQHQVKAHEQHHKADSGASMTVEADKASTNADMTQDQKDAINAINKKTVEDEQDIKVLEKRIKERNQILDDLLVPKNQEFNIWDNWKNYINNEKNRNQSIIDLPHPKLNHLDEKDIRNFIYKNFKDELIEFKKEKDKLKDIKIKIKDLDNALLFRGSRQQKAEKEQQEQIERMTLLALHLTHLIMYKIGLTKQKPHALSYMTQQQINEYKKQYHHNQYAQTFMQANGIHKCINAIAERKKMERDGVLLDWSEREEVQQAKEQIRKILRIEKLDINEFNQDEHQQYNELIKNKYINNVNELLTEKNIRISKEEQEQDNEFAPDDNIENDKEIEKKLYRQKVKKSGPSFNR